MSLCWVHPCKSLFSDLADQFIFSGPFGSRSFLDLCEIWVSLNHGLGGMSCDTAFPGFMHVREMSGKFIFFQGICQGIL